MNNVLHCSFLPAYELVDLVQGVKSGAGGLELEQRRSLLVTFHLPGEDSKTIDLNIQHNKVER
jgi:hypothetical protein